MEVNKLCVSYMLFMYVTRTLYFNSSTLVGSLTLGHEWDTSTLHFGPKKLKTSIEQLSWTLENVPVSDMGT